jgi:hypothetical protein
MARVIQGVARWWRWARVWVIRQDIEAELRRRGRLEADGRVACRLIALADALDGMNREQAARPRTVKRSGTGSWASTPSE